MKVVIVNSRDLGGGAARSAFRLHQALRQIGVDSSMLVRSKKSEDPGAQAFKRDTSPASRQALEAWKELTREQIDENRSGIGDAFFTLPVPGYDLARHELIQTADIINLHWVSTVVSPETLKSLLRLGKPIVWTLHDQRPFTGGCHFSFGCKGYERDCADCPQLRDHSAGLTEQTLDWQRRVGGIEQICPVCPSHWMAECARRSRVFNKCRIEVIPNSLETDIFRPRSRKEARESLGLDPDGFWFLFGAHGIADQRKGFGTLIEAAQKCMANASFRARLEQGKIRFVGFGGGEHPPDFGGVPVTNIGFINSDEQLASVYAASDLFLCPTLEDNLPNTILEALSCGTPVLASRVGGVPDLVRDAVNGRMFAPRDSDALSRLMLELSENPAPLEQFSKAARADVEARFPLQVQAKAYADLFADLLQSKPLGAPRILPSSAKLSLLPAQWTCHHPVGVAWLRCKLRLGALLK